MLKKLLYVLSVSGSIMAFHVGSGFASGQEIFQFYTSYGPVNGCLVGVVSFFLFTIISYTVLEIGRQYKTEPVKMQYYRLGGTFLGGMFFHLTPILLLVVLFVTIAGGGAAAEKLFGLPTIWGRVLTGVPVLLTVLLGLRWITAFSGSIGPIIIVCAIGLGFFGIVQGYDTELWTLLPHTSSHWFISAVSYAGFGSITLIPFLLTVGAQLNDRRVSAWVSFLGNSGYILAGTLLHLGLYRCLPQTLGEQLPTLRLANRISEFAGWFYGIILLFSIYTTAVPMLWSVSKSIQPNETSAGYRVSAVILAVFCCIGFKMPFDRLQGILYPYIGYISAIFFAVMLVRIYVLPKSAGSCKGQRDESAA